MKKVMIVGLISVLVLSACDFRPQSKDAYLKRFESFVEQVKEDGKTYSADKWQEMDELFEKYTESWYLEYKEEMSLEEKLEVKKMALKYAMYRGRDNILNGIGEGLKALEALGDELIDAVEIDTTGSKLKIEIELDE